MVSAAITTAFAQENAEAAHQRRSVADPMRAKVPKLAALTDETAHDVLAFMDFPRLTGSVRIHSTNPLETLNAEIAQDAKMSEPVPAGPGPLCKVAKSPSNRSGCDGVRVSGRFSRPS